MLRLHGTTPTRLFQALSIGAMILAIAPTAQAAPKMAQRVATQDQPLCFVQLPGKTKKLDKLCGLDSKINNMIDIDIDRNRDGISDQLLAATQQHLDIRGAAQKQFEAQLQRDPNFDMEAGIEALNALTDKLGREFNARKPYSSRVKQLFAAENRIVVQLSQLQPSQTQEYKALEAKKIQIYQTYSRDPNYIKIEQAQTKVLRVIDRRGSAQWLYGTSGKAIPD
jgi:hypothetical protein